MLETRTKERNAHCVITHLSRLFHMHELVYGNGFSRGIWVFWDLSSINLNLLEKTNQHITFSACETGCRSRNFHLSAVYASPNWQVRRQLWENLPELHSTHFTSDFSWLQVGDFNYILSHQDKMGGRADPFSLPNREFKEFLDSTSVSRKSTTLAPPLPGVIIDGGHRRF